MSRSPHTEPEKLYLWSASGGVCSHTCCNERLVQETEGKLCNVGIKAHIIGNAPGSERKEFTKVFGEEYGFWDDLDDVRNIILCVIGSATLSWTEKIRACRIDLSSEGADLYNAKTTTTYLYS